VHASVSVYQQRGTNIPVSTLALESLLTNHLLWPRS